VKAKPIDADGYIHRLGCHGDGTVYWGPGQSCGGCDLRVSLGDQAPFKMRPWWSLATQRERLVVWWHNVCGT